MKGELLSLLLVLKFYLRFLNGFINEFKSFREKKISAFIVSILAFELVQLLFLIIVSSLNFYRCVDKNALRISCNPNSKHHITVWRVITSIFTPRCVWIIPDILVIVGFAIVLHFKPIRSRLYWLCFLHSLLIKLLISRPTSDPLSPSVQRFGLLFFNSSSSFIHYCLLSYYFSLLLTIIMPRQSLLRCATVAVVVL